MLCLDDITGRHALSKRKWRKSESGGKQVGWRKGLGREKIWVCRESLGGVEGEKFVVEMYEIGMNK